MQKFDFNDMNLIPKKCVVSSRSECDTSITFGGNKFKLPVVPANMECVINEELAIKLAENGYFYIIHRFGNDPVKFTTTMKELGLIASISLGVNEDSYDIVDELSARRLSPDYITIDIAHGHSIKMEAMLKYVKGNLPKAFVIAGNVSSVESIPDLEEWGADAIKVGISPGSACTTFPSTAFGSRNCQASTVMECVKVSNVPIIADGGIRVPGDIARCMVLGASMVMIGGMLSGFKDSPGNVVIDDGRYKKEFWGSASASQAGKTNRVEGIKVLVDYKDRSLLDELTYLEECLQSSISYGGGKDISSLNDVRFF